MPCVFPVLSIKAIGLVEQAKKHPAAVRAKGLVFAAGVIGSMLGLAAVLLALRAGGEQIGWGFQLQSPLFVTLMVYLLLAIGLNLSGVFEVGGALAGVGDELTQGEGYRAAFFTGVLTTLVATPCTAPFMAAAVGAALTQSPLVALVIFAGLGVGLALAVSIAVVCAVDPSARCPNPAHGWKRSSKYSLSRCMHRRRGCCGFSPSRPAHWVWVPRWRGPSSSRWRPGLIKNPNSAAPAAVRPPWYGGLGARARRLPAGAICRRCRCWRRYGGATAASPHGTDAWQPYDAARLADMNAAGKPLLVNFTASWCLTCLVNERNAFADSAVQEIFRDKGVTLMKGDWTSRDPAITRALGRFRSCRRTALPRVQRSPRLLGTGDIAATPHREHRARCVCRFARSCFEIAPE